ncbi:light harvesting complex protein, partial [Nannochloropsis oceanica]
THTCCLR